MEDEMTVMQTDRKAQLLARRADLIRRIDAAEAELESHSSRDWDDQALLRETDEVLSGLGLSAQAEARMVDAALARIDAGTFGICARCGADIGADRLDAVPYTPFCRDCAA
jgi:RNA polymerase-binding transcription factor DksA